MHMLLRLIAQIIHCTSLTVATIYIHATEFRLLVWSGARGCGVRRPPLFSREGTHY